MGVLIDRIIQMRQKGLVGGAKASLKLSGDINLTRARFAILNWTIDSMPQIARHHGIPEAQALDSIQHYRFGFVQALNIMCSAGLPVPDADFRQTLNLFTSVHDLGRMMTGSGATEDRYSQDGQGAFLHPVIGSLMLREVFGPFIDNVSAEVRELLEALIYIAERHSLSVGMAGSVFRRTGIEGLGEPFKGQTSLLLKDAPIAPKYRFYAHLAALADLANNVDKKLEGCGQYFSGVDLEGMGTISRINYIETGPADGSFTVRRQGDTTTTWVNRYWKGGDIKTLAFWEILKKMSESVVSCFGGNEAEEMRDAFWIGVGRLARRS